MQSPKRYTNRLAGETSPYLLQHAHNPVDWYPWGEEAFEKARSDDKPVLVSIGYSACHWCHVMEHESFEDEATAVLMNEHFVNIKVDMEERPDVDQIYMTFVQITTGHGGWPMNVFMTPDKLPFFGGTYFPPERRYNMPSFKQVLASIAEAYTERRDELLRSANDILGELRRVSIGSGTAVGLDTEVLDHAFQSHLRSFDASNGGFGGAPKFPSVMSLEFLLRYHGRTGNVDALEMVRKTCEKMAAGGIYDQLGGGFHRYSVDAVWLVPHFEKMLYDNAQLCRVYLHLFQITRDDQFKQTAVEILEYLKREMLDADGGFYSTQDADSEGVEGKFFVWTPDEIEALLGENDAQIFDFYYDVSEEGNFEEKNILNRKYSSEAAARALRIDSSELENVLNRSREVLFREREKRIKPFRDEKVLTAWNGLALAAFAEAAAILDSAEYLEIAKRNADFLLANLQADGRLLRTWKTGTAKLNAYVEDYASLCDGLIELYQVSGEITYLTEAKRLADSMIVDFWDAESGGFFFTSNEHEELIVRNKDFFDNATPSGNSVAADVLTKLSRFFGDDKYHRFATKVLQLAAQQIRRHPLGFGRALAAIESQIAGSMEVVIVGEKGNELDRTLWRNYLPNKIVVLSNDPAKEAGSIGLLEGKTAFEDKPTAYVCRDFVCRKPVGSVAEFERDLIEG